MNFFRDLLALCGSFENYRSIRDLPFSTSLKFLLKLMGLVTLVTILSFIPVVREGTNELARRFDRQRPKFSIAAGRIVTEAKQPQSWGDARLRFVLDTTGRITGPDPDARQGLLFMSDQVLFWTTITNSTPPLVHQQAVNLKGFPEGPVTGAYFHRLVKWMLPVAVPVTWLTLILLGSLTALAQAYFFAVIASLMERSLAAPLRLNQLLNIGVHAVTPAVLLVTIYAALRLPGLDFWLVYLIVYGIFLVGATNACRDNQRRPEPAGTDFF